MAGEVLYDDDVVYDDVVYDDEPVEDQQLKNSLDDTAKGIKGFGHGMRHSGALGWDDELGGGVQAAMQAITGDVKDESGNPVPALDVYRQGRNGNRMEEANVVADSHGEYGLGEIAGILLPTNRGGTAKQSALTGAMAGLGNSEADLTDGEYGHAAFDTTMGGLFGAGAHKFGGWAGGKAGDFLNWLSKKAGEKGAEASGKILGEAAGKEMGRYAKETGAQGPAQAEMWRKMDILGKIDPSPLERPELIDNVTEFLSRQIPKAVDVVEGWRPPKDIAPVTAESIEKVADVIRKEGWAVAKTKFGKEIVDAVLRDIDKLPGGTTAKMLFKAGARKVQKYVNPVTTEAFFNKAKEVLKNNPSAYGELGSIILNSQDTIVTDFIMSQTDPAWREMKEKLTGDEETPEEDSRRGHVRVLDPNTGEVLYGD